MILIMTNPMPTRSEMTAGVTQSIDCGAQFVQRLVKDKGNCMFEEDGFLYSKTKIALETELTWHHDPSVQAALVDLTADSDNFEGNQKPDSPGKPKNDSDYDDMPDNKKKYRDQLQGEHNQEPEVKRHGNKKETSATEKKKRKRGCAPKAGPAEKLNAGRQRQNISLDAASKQKASGSSKKTSQKSGGGDKRKSEQRIGIKRNKKNSKETNAPKT